MEPIFSSNGYIVESLNGAPWAFLRGTNGETAPVLIFQLPFPMLKVPGSEDNALLSVPLSSNVTLCPVGDNPNFVQLHLEDINSSYGFTFSSTEITSYFLTSFQSASSPTTEDAPPAFSLAVSRAESRGAIVRRARGTKVAASASEFSSAGPATTPPFPRPVRSSTSAPRPTSIPPSIASAKPPPPPPLSSPITVSVSMSLSPSQSPHVTATASTSMPFLAGTGSASSASASACASPPPLPPLEPASTPLGLMPLDDNGEAAPSVPPRESSLRTILSPSLRNRRHSFNAKTSSLLSLSAEAQKLLASLPQPAQPPSGKKTDSLSSMSSSSSAALASVSSPSFTSSSPASSTEATSESPSASSCPSTPSSNASSSNPRRRLAIVQEMLQVQQSYLRILEGLEANLRQPLLQASVLSTEDLNMIFPVFPELIGLHREFAARLESRIAQWTDSSTIADIWQSSVPLFQRIYPDYAAAYQTCLDSNFLPKLASKHKKLASLLKKYQTISGLDKLTINTHLGQPVQQVPRYVMLLQNLLKATDASEESYPHLQAALTAFSDLALEINAGIQAEQNNKAMEAMRTRGVNFESLPECTLQWTQSVTVAGYPYDQLCLTDQSVFFTSVVKERGPALGVVFGRTAAPVMKLEQVLDLLNVWAILHHDQGTSDRFTLVAPGHTFVITPKGSKDAATISRFVDILHSQMRKTFNERGCHTGILPSVSAVDPLGARRFDWRFADTGVVYQGWWLDGQFHGEGQWVDVDNNKYMGSFVNGKRHGEGVYTFATGGSYQGSWVRGKPQGSGRMLSAWGDVYVGDWNDGERHGQGKLVWLNGEKYEGSWRLGHFHGSGTLELACGYAYTGEFELSQPHGQGELKFRGNTYTGAFSAGIRQGLGTLVYQNGDTYVGSFASDQLSGKGKLTRADGAWSYEGTFVSGNIVGFGIIIAKNDYHYQGQVSHGQRSGTGTCTYDNGFTYTGDWESDVYHGQGKLSGHGVEFDGHWRMGIREGEGTAKFADGSAYEGSWLGNVAHGNGRLTDSAGNTYKGDFVSGRRSGPGQYFTQDGLYFYRGNWLDDRKHGEGTEIDRNFGTYTGTFERGLRHGQGKFVSSDKSWSIEGPWRLGYFAGLMTHQIGAAPPIPLSFEFDANANKPKPNFNLCNFLSPLPPTLWKS